MFQSTHPRRVRLRLKSQTFSASKFQSTHPRRVRPKSVQALPNSDMFQSTHPRRVRPDTFASICTKWSFNPRTHVGCDWIKQHEVGILNWFQSTHPRRVRRNNGKNQRQRSEFQSTHPRRVRLILLLIVLQQLCFNPRTHVGCDFSLSAAVAVVVSFNPRTHVGCDSFQ